MILMSPKTKDDLLDQLDSTRERLLVALEYVPDETLMEPGVIGDWAIADLLSLLTAWDAEVVTGLMRLKQGKTPDRLLAALSNAPAYEAERLVENEGRDLDSIFEDFQGARVHLEDWIERFSDKALTEPGHFKALGNRSLMGLIIAATSARESFFLPQLEELGRAWAGEDEGSSTPGIIPLIGIESLDSPDNTHENGHHSE